jgi:tetratricopeptide (TPR) repeat protein
MKKRITTGTAQIEPRFILWRKIRFPLAAAITVIVLVATGIIVWFIYDSQHLRAQLTSATVLTASDTLEGHRGAAYVLDRLVVEYPDDQSVRARLAWQKVLVILRFGAPPDRIEAAGRTVADASQAGTSSLLDAARAGLRLLSGEAAEALEIIGDQAETPEELFVAGLAASRLGRNDDALSWLDRARQGEPPFLPALAELATLLREQGRFDEANAALEVLTAASPGHQGGVIEKVLLELDRDEDDATKLGQTESSLTRTMEDLRIDDDLPRLKASERMAVGRLALIRGEDQQAIDDLTAAKVVFADHQRLSTWLAMAYRRSGRHEEALEALAPFADQAATDPRLLKVKAQVLMDLQRTADAEAPLAVLLARGEPEVIVMEGRRRLGQGDLAGAAPFLERALKAGLREAAFDLAESLMLQGQAHKAQVVLRRVQGDSTEPLCAGGYSLGIIGRTRRAIDRLKQASEGGGRCGATLAGRLLIGTGNDEDLETRLVKALEAREDLRDRVALGRVRFRTKGQQAARDELDRVRALRPQSVLVLHELAQAYDELGLRQVASEVAGEGAERTGGQPMLVALSADYAREADDLDGAEEILSRGLKAHPSSAELALVRALVLFDRERFAQAGDALEDALVDGPTYSRALCFDAEILNSLGDRQEAQVALARGATRAKARSGARSEAEIRACQVEIQLRRGPASLGRAKTAIFFLKQLPLIWAHTFYLDGEIAERENRPGLAEEHYRKALELDPADQESWHQLAVMDRLNEDDLARFQNLWPGQSPDRR